MENMFSIEVEAGSSFGHSICVYMEPKESVMDVAKRLSESYTDRDVTVQMYARIRRHYRNGQMISSSPNIWQFYTKSGDKREDGQMVHNWTCFGQVNE